MAALALGATAQTDADYLSYGKLGASNPRLWGSPAHKLYEENLERPNATHSVSFRPFEWLTQHPEIAEKEWTWRELLPCRRDLPSRTLVPCQKGY